MNGATTCPVCGHLMVADTATAEQRRALMREGIMPPAVSRHGGPVCSTCGTAEALAAWALRDLTPEDLTG